jgi:hypothetical protein
MRGGRLIAASALALALCPGTVLAATQAGAAVTHAATPKPKPKSKAASRMLVYAQEWSLYASRASLPAGRVTVQLWDRGEDPHDLRIRRLKRGGVMYGQAHGVALTPAGKIGEATWRLGAGRYELYCSLPGHRARGMHTTLVVR